MSYLPSRASTKRHLADVFKLMPLRSRLLLALHEEAMRGRSPLSTAEPEMIVAFGSGLNGCNYCHNAHKHVAAELGVELTVFEELVNDIDRAPVADKMKPILRFVRKLTQTPSEVGRADAQAIYDAGWSEDAFLDVVTICVLLQLF